MTNIIDESRLMELCLLQCLAWKLGQSHLKELTGSTVIGLDEVRRVLNSGNDEAGWCFRSMEKM